VVIIEVSGVGLVAAHVVGGNHALVLTDSFVAVHGNKFKQVIFIKSDKVLK
jgi:hypothetical protein